MPDIYVVPSETAAILEAEGLPLSILNDVEAMVQKLTAPDLARIELAFRAFPFEFGIELDVQLALTPLTRMRESGQHAAFIERVEGRIEQLRLNLEADGVNFTPVYTLNPVDENVWVAMQQRLHQSGSDPSSQLLSSNQAFFDALIDQSLQLHSFKTVSGSNLFRYYLGSLPAKAA